MLGRKKHLLSEEGKVGGVREKRRAGLETGAFRCTPPDGCAGERRKTREELFLDDAAYHGLP